jgi:uncharacterized protein YcfL
MKPHRLLSAVLAAAAAAFLSGGCATSSETGALLPENTEHFGQEKDASFVLMDSGAQRSVTHSGIRSATLPDGRLEASALVRNRESRRLQVQVQCVFKDGNGHSTGDETPWQTLILTENGMETVTFQSMNDKARAFTFRVREAR